jgi:hypothetical protein
VAQHTIELPLQPGVYIVKNEYNTQVTAVKIQVR